MRPILFASVFAVISYALGANISPENLAGEKLCFLYSNVQIDESDQYNQDRLATKIYQSTMTKLAAYRIPVDEALSCPASSNSTLWIQVGITSGAPPNAYLIHLDVYDETGKVYPGVISKYNLGSYGYSGKTGFDLEELISSYTGGLIDTLAAGYAKANP